MDAIPQNVFWIIIAAMVVFGIIIAVIQWRSVREADKNVEYLSKLAKLKKIDLKERDLESKRLKENILSLPKNQQEHLAKIRGDTSQLIQKVGHLNSKVNERVNSLETRTEYKQLKKLIMDIEKNEKQLEKNLKTKMKGFE